MMRTASPTASQRRQALLAALLKKEGLHAGSADEIPRRPKGARTPLSSGQLRLWFIHQVNPESPVYNVPACFRVHGHLDLPRFRQALQFIVSRHEILRTTFTVDDQGPVQIVSPQVLIKSRVIDLPGRETEARRLLVEEARLPFDLAAGPLLRACVVRLAEDDHLALLTLHHIVCDAWSITVLMRELSTLLSGAAIMSELPIQYGDFAAWQQQALNTNAIEEQLDYWTRQLADAPPVLDLPLDRPRPAVHTFQGAMTTRHLSSELVRSLKSLGHSGNTTLFITLLAAFKTLLHRYTGQTAIVVASPIATRDRSELEDLIGFFPNTLLLRTDLSQDPSFADALRAVRSTALDAYANQSAPFEQVLEKIRPGAQSTPFQVAFLLQNASSYNIQLPGLEITPLDLDIGTAKCDLTLSVVELAEGMDATIEYNTGIFEAATIHRLISHFENLLTGIVTNPNAPLSQLPLLAAAERHQR